MQPHSRSCRDWGCWPCCRPGGGQVGHQSGHGRARVSCACVAAVCRERPDSLARVLVVAKCAYLRPDIVTIAHMNNIGIEFDRDSSCSHRSDDDLERYDGLRRSIRRRSMRPAHRSVRADGPASMVVLVVLLCILVGTTITHAWAYHAGRHYNVTSAFEARLRPPAPPLRPRRNPPTQAPPAPAGRGSRSLPRTDTPGSASTPGAAPGTADAARTPPTGSPAAASGTALRPSSAAASPLQPSVSDVTPAQVRVDGVEGRD